MENGQFGGHFLSMLQGHSNGEAQKDNKHLLNMYDYFNKSPTPSPPKPEELSTPSTSTSSTSTGSQSPPNINAIMEPAISMEIIESPPSTLSPPSTSTSSGSSGSESPTYFNPIMFAAVTMDTDEPTPSTSTGVTASQSKPFVENAIPPLWAIEKSKLEQEHPNGVPSPKRLEELGLTKEQVIQRFLPKRRPLSIEATIRAELLKANELELFNKYMAHVKTKFPIDTSYHPNKARTYAQPSEPSATNENGLSEAERKEQNEQSKDSRFKKKSEIYEAAYTLIFFRERIHHHAMRHYAMKQFLMKPAKNEMETNEEKQARMDCNSHCCGSDDSDDE